MKKDILTTVLIMLLFFVGLSPAFAGPTTSQEYDRANKMFAQGKFKDAIALYQAVLSSPSSDIAPGILYTRIGDGYFRLGDYSNARDAYRGALKDEKSTECAQNQYWIGFCCLMQGKDAEAVSEFLKIPERYPSEGMWVGTAYYWAARACERMGRKEQAAELYRKAGGNGKSTQERFALKKAETVRSK